ncbi:MAG TPA: hypothetical protein VIX84_06960 [Acidimicrobiales bacterium]
MADMQGYWTFASDGWVFNDSSGPNAGSQFLGSTGNIHLNKPVVGGDAT